ncbi:MAG TPA: hypothetical protein VGH54_16805 [Mycobacterium sp.]|jgi:hypothetical protein|uniref:hypothetical protein n=1 Tax=Mycobacterium sp. TaxID=1785 RepID=UPI002F4288E9
MTGEPYESWLKNPPLGHSQILSIKYSPGRDAARERAAKADREREAAEFEEKKRAVAAEHAANLEGPNDLRRAVLALHYPEVVSSYTHRHVCMECRPEGYEFEEVYWPCDTYILARDWADTP